MRWSEAKSQNSIKHGTDWRIPAKQHTNTHSDAKMSTKYIHEQR